MRKIMYIVVNKDLGMSIGKASAQASHACFDYILEKYDELVLEGESFGEFMDAFKDSGDTIVVLEASESKLLKWESEGYVAVRDMGYTEVKGGSITAVNLGIYDKGEGIPKWIQRLRLLKNEVKEDVDTYLKDLGFEVVDLSVCKLYVNKLMKEVKVLNGVMYIDSRGNHSEIKMSIGNTRESVLAAYTYCVKNYGVALGGNTIRKDIVSILGLEAIVRDSVKEYINSMED